MYTTYISISSLKKNRYAGIRDIGLFNDFNILGEPLFLQKKGNRAIRTERSIICIVLSMRQRRPPADMSKTRT
jgi:hypothetical protein